MLEQLKNNKLRAAWIWLPLIIYALSAPMIVRAETVDEAASRIGSPENIEDFYREGFSSVLKIPDVEQSPQETLDLKSGDCDDFAKLSQAILKHFGIDGEIVYIRFKDLKSGHAICAWKEGGYYNYFDAKRLVKTKETSIQEVMSKYSSDLECCTACERKLSAKTNDCE